MSPFCSRSRSPSARNKKSNLARSAVRAKCAKELNSMWLPAAGSLHTVVLLTPGEWAARWICFSGLLMVVGPSGSVGDCGVAVGGAGQYEEAAQGAGLVGAAEQAPALEFGHEAPGDARQVVAEHRRPQPETGETGAVQLLQQVRELAGGAGEDPGVTGVRGAREGVEALAAVR